MTPCTRRALLMGMGLAATAASGLALANNPGDAAPPAEVSVELPGARLQGRSTLRFLGLRIYDARLWRGAAPVGDDWSSMPFALELQYARELKGDQIAERSLQEMRRQGEIPAASATTWLAQMKQIFPDVKDGDRITGVNRPGEGVRFFLNGRARGEPRDAEFAKWFFGIWFSPRTSEPALRLALLGSGS